MHVPHAVRVGGQTGTPQASKEHMNKLEILLAALAFTLAVAHGYLHSKSRREGGPDGR
jgi:hypothetical protein